MSCGPLAAGSAVAASSISAVLDRAVNQFNRDVCRTIESLHCGRKGATAPKPKTTASPPDTVVPIPRMKPRSHKAVAKAAKTPTREANISSPPVPRPKPALPAAAGRKPVEEVHDKVATVGTTYVEVVPPKASHESAPKPSPDSETTCRDELRALGMNFSTPATPVSSGQCDVANPVQLKAWSSGGETLAFPGSPILNCAFALRFGTWLKAEGTAIARQSVHSTLAEVHTGPGYQCRGRNGDSDAKISEHGYGNAVDITYFTVKDGRKFLVKDATDPKSPAYVMLAGFRASACKYFTTVLGPGANTAHAEHFHFDLGKHGRSGTYRICE